MASWRSSPSDISRCAVRRTGIEGEELEVSVAEPEEDVCRAVVRVAPPPGGLSPEHAPKGGGRRLQVCYAYHDMIEIEFRHVVVLQMGKPPLVA